MIDFECPECEGRLEAASWARGRRGSCPRCGARVTVPPSKKAGGAAPERAKGGWTGDAGQGDKSAGTKKEAMQAKGAKAVSEFRVSQAFLRTLFVYDCPGCGEELKSSWRDAGKKDKCPVCSQEFVVPGERGARQERGQGDRQADGMASECNGRPPAIGGCLILWAIWLIFGGVWLGLTWILLVGFLRDYVESYGAALILVYYLGLTWLWVVAYKRFFGKKRNAPAAMIGLLLALCGTGVLAFFVMLPAIPEIASSPAVLVEVGWTIFVAGIGIAYFKMSKRVKATFVRGTSGTDGERDGSKEEPKDGIEPRGGGKMIVTTCEGCGRRIKAPEEFAGRKAKCPGCGAVLRLPGAKAFGEEAP